MSIPFTTPPQLVGFGTGGILFTDATGVVKQDTPNFAFDVGNTRLGIGTNVPTSALNILELDATTTTVTVPIRMVHTSSGVPASGFGIAFRFQAHDSTNVVRTLADVEGTWNVATAATRKGRLRLLVYDGSTAREGLRVDVDGTNPMIGFLGAAAVVRQAINAAATDAATTQALTNTIRTALINLGLTV